MTMRVVTLAPDVAIRRLRAHIGADKLVETETLAQFESAVRAGGIRWVIIDPMAMSESGFDTAVELIADAGIRVTFYSRLEGFSHSRLLSAYGRVDPEVFFHETDDDWSRLAFVLRRTDASVPARMIRAILPRAVRLPARLCDRTTRLFCWGTVPMSVEEFGEESSVSAGALRRHFESVGLASPLTLLTIARLSRTYDDLRNVGATLESIAHDNGFGSRRALERAVRALAGASPRVVASECDAREFARRLTEKAF